MPNLLVKDVNSLSTNLLTFCNAFEGVYQPGEGEENRFKKIHGEFTKALRNLRDNNGPDGEGIYEGYDDELYNKGTSEAIMGLLDGYAADFQKMADQFKAKIDGNGPKDLRNEFGLAAVNGIQAYIKASGKGYDPTTKESELEGAQLFRGAMNMLSNLYPLVNNEELNQHEEIMRPIIDFMNQSAELLNKQVEYAEAKNRPEGISAEQDLKYREEIFELNQSLNQKAKDIVEKEKSLSGNGIVANTIRSIVNEQEHFGRGVSLNEFLVASDEYLSAGKPQLNQSLIGAAPKENIINDPAPEKSDRFVLKEVKLEDGVQKDETIDFKRVSDAMDLLSSRRWFVSSGGTTEYTQLRDYAKQVYEKLKAVSTGVDKNGRTIKDDEADALEKEVFEMASELKNRADTYVRAKSVDMDREHPHTWAGKDRFAGAKAFSQIAEEIMSKQFYKDYMESKKEVKENEGNIINTSAGKSGGNINEMSVDEMAEKINGKEEKKSFERPKQTKPDEITHVNENGKDEPVLEGNFIKK